MLDNLTIKLDSVPLPRLGRGRFHQHVYEQLLHAQIPKAQTGTDDLTVFFPLLSSEIDVNWSQSYNKCVERFAFCVSKPM